MHMERGKKEHTVDLAKTMPGRGVLSPKDIGRMESKVQKYL